MKRAVLTGTAVVALCAGVARAEMHYKMCRANERGNRFSLCQTSIQPGISVLCSQYAPKGAPPTAGIPVMSWECKDEGEGSSRSITCTGGQFYPHKTVRSLTYDEFVDSDKRCSKLCDPCASGWEAWE